MPSLNASLGVSVSNRIRSSGSPARPVGMPTPAPPLPTNLSQSTIMLSSLPSIATNVDGITRQFYGTGRNLPTRRLILPG
jgi:hypothetical protein